MQPAPDVPVLFIHDNRWPRVKFVFFGAMDGELVRFPTPPTSNCIPRCGLSSKHPWLHRIWLSPGMASQYRRGRRGYLWRPKMPLGRAGPRRCRASTGMARRGTSPAPNPPPPTAAGTARRPPPPATADRPPPLYKLVYSVLCNCNAHEVAFF